MGANDGPAAASAAAAFAGGRYGEALGLLERLRDKQPTDPKASPGPGPLPAMPCSPGHKQFLLCFLFLLRAKENKHPT